MQYYLTKRIVDRVINKLDKAKYGDKDLAWLFKFIDLDLDSQMTIIDEIVKTRNRAIEQEIEKKKDVSISKIGALKIGITKKKATEIRKKILSDLNLSDNELTEEEKDEISIKVRAKLKEEMKARSTVMPNVAPLFKFDASKIKKK